MNKDIGLISDNQAEAGVIASVICHPEYILRVDYLKEKYFYNVENGCIYYACKLLVKDGVTNIDAMNLTSAINSNGAVRKKIEEYNISDIQNFINMSQYAARHTFDEFKLLVNNIISCAYKRELYKFTTRVQSLCFNEEQTLLNLNHYVDKEINDLTEKFIVTEEVDLFGDMVDNLWKEVMDRADGGVYGIPFKIDSFNKYTTLIPGELVILKARMKRGKSAFFLNETVHKLKNGISVLYIDTEMQDRLFYERMLANLSGVEVNKIKTKTYSQEEARLLADANEFIKKAPLVHKYMPQATDDEIYSLCKVMQYKYGLQLVIYDYIKQGSVLSSSEASNYLGQKTDFLKNRIAGELNLAVLAGAQLGRTGEVADSDKLERYCSTSIFWDSKTQDMIVEDGGIDGGNFYARVDLNRNGEQMTDDERINISFDGGRMRIVESKHQHTSQSTPFD